MRTLPLIILALLLSACAGKKPYVEYENSAMANTVKVSEIRTRNQFDLQQFSVDLTNKTGKEVRLQYKFKFFDKDGFEVMADSRPWTRKILSAKETVAIQVAAPDASVIGGKIYIKE